MVNRKKQLRPSPGGVSCGHYQVSAGTLGGWVKKNGEWMMLSNNHVLANCNEAKIGDPILQPGSADGGTEEIGKLYKFIPISFTEISKALSRPARIINFFLKPFRLGLLAYRLGKPNSVDCALAKPNRPEDISPMILEGDNTLIEIKGGAEPELGMRIKKSGRTTGTTHGTISQTDVAVNVNMGEGRGALFVDQFMTEDAMSEPGDSGSLILTENNKAVGLLFAGSKKVTLGNRWSNVKRELGIS